jgi:hypothetical protein
MPIILPNWVTIDFPCEVRAIFDLPRLATVVMDDNILLGISRAIASLRSIEYICGQPDACGADGPRGFSGSHWVMEIQDSLGESIRDRG